ncbi:MAG TPA: 2'-5' RNA ligase family protein [Terriglobales bacterium]|nr:2'-5' RNA ligase family protein [Terriglobales bacterium]
MASQYALVAYVRNEVGEFVEKLRHELHPEHAHSPAHISILPPRCLAGSEPDALRLLQQVVRQVEPFEAVMGEVQTFLPSTPTVFIRVAHAAYRVRELHDRLNAGALQADEPWPFMPHLTLFKMDTNGQAQAALGTAVQLWAQYCRSRRIVIDQLTFVRNLGLNQWADIASFPLGSRAAIPE